MRESSRIQTLSIAAAMSFLALAGTAARAATMSASLTPPPVNGADIANFATVNGNDKWFNEDSAAGATKGQTFTTGSSAVLLKAITYQIVSSQKAEPKKTYVIRVGTVSGTNFTQIASETATQTFTWNASEYMTWTFSTPILLAANTTYGVDVGMTGSTSSWETGIPYINVTANAFAGGVRYSSGTLGVGTSTLTLVATSDRIFHLDMEDPMRPSPENGATVPAGNVDLIWRNMAPNTGSNVWVDVWFGTNSGALTRIVTNGLNTTNTTVSASGAATYYWRVNSYLDGAPTGTPVTGTLFSFVVFDSDADGLPDAYELAYTTPPSATSMTPGGDLDSDGLTNLQEYQRGTLPNNPDTDGDTLQDGVEVAGAGARPPTNPLLADTDGDGLSDGVESNTGIWVGAANTGTNPTKADTDADGLKDGVETHTGIYVSPTNTGTNPLLADSDGDGAADWYEVAAAYTNPNNASDKPNIPYPLPKPDATPPATNKPVKVFILSGQSNMVGMGNVDPADTPGTLATIIKQQGKFPNLLATNGNWSVRNDVKYRGVISAIGNALLAVGQGADAGKIGPELGFGHVMGYSFNEPVLLIKSSIGNRSLLWDCLPPGSPRFDYNGNTYAGYGDSPNFWPIGGGPSPFGWYAGKEYDDYFLAEADMGAPAWATAVAYPANCQVRRNGVTYISKSAHTSAADSEPGVGAQWATYWNVYSVFNVTDILDNWATEYPQWAAQGFEIAGFVWWQGNKDLGEPGASRYETNLVNLIKKVRPYYENRYPGKCSTNTPFVLATGCGDPQTNGNGLVVANAQLAVTNAVKYPEFAANVKTMDTRGYWRDVAESPVNQGYHYNRNAETYMLVGDALGRGMIELLSAGTGGDTNPPTALFTATPTNGFAPLTVAFADTSTNGAGSITNRSWSFGDGGFTNFPGANLTFASTNFTRHYTSVSNYSVTLTVTNSDGLASSTNTTISVAAVPTPTFRTAGAISVNASGQPTFTMEATNGIKYRIVYKDDLLNTNGWTALPQGWTGGTNDGPLSITDLSATNSPRRFYKVEAVSKDAAP